MCAYFSVQEKIAYYEKVKRNSRVGSPQYERAVARLSVLGHQPNRKPKNSNFMNKKQAIYHHQRSQDMRLPESVRERSRKETDRLYQKILSDEKPTMVHSRGTRLGMVKSVSAWMKDISDRKMFFLGRNDSPRKRQEIKELDQFQRDIERYVARNRLSHNSDLFIVQPK